MFTILVREFLGISLSLSNCLKDRLKKKYKKISIRLLLFQMFINLISIVERINEQTFIDGSYLIGIKLLSHFRKFKIFFLRQDSTKKCMENLNCICSLLMSAIF